MKNSEVIELLGNPQHKTQFQWFYSFFECSLPPQVGEQTVLGIAITFETEIIIKLDYATICATGPGNSAPIKKNAEEIANFNRAFS